MSQSVVRRSLGSTPYTVVQSEDDKRGDLVDQAAVISQLGVACGVARIQIAESHEASLYEERKAQGLAGFCIGYDEGNECGVKIPYARLKAHPTAVRCVPCQEIYEERNRPKKLGRNKK